MQKMEVGAQGISVSNFGQNTLEVSVRVDPADGSKHSSKKKRRASESPVWGLLD